MRKKHRFIVTLLLVFLLPVVSRAEWTWQIDVMPASALVNFDQSAFSLQGSGDSAMNKESISLLSTMPNITGGISIEKTRGNLEFRVGPGFLLNSRVRSTMLLGMVGASAEIKPSVFLGAHLLVSQFWDGTWWGDGKVDLDPNNPGFGGGIHITVGDKVSYLLSIDYMSISFDATGQEGWTPSDDKLDFSGIAVQFGVRANF